MSTERAAHYTFGPRFFTEGEAVMFEFAIDHGNKIGPRKATDADKAKHHEAWAAFEAGEKPAEQAAPADTRPPSAPVADPEIIEHGNAKAKKRGRPPKASE